MPGVALREYAADEKVEPVSKLKMGKKKQTQLPMCTYGPGCTRPGCIYRHPPKGVIPKTEAICMPFVAGFCEFGVRCRNVHPCERDAEALRRKYARTPCEWGAQCRNKLCLYSHPQPDDELAAYGLAGMGLQGRIEPAAAHHNPPMPLLPGGVWQEDLHDAGQLTWEEHLQQSVAASAASGSRSDRSPNAGDGSGAGGAAPPDVEASSFTLSFTAGGDSSGGAPQCAECGRVSDGCVDATNGCFYCDACWDAFDAKAPADAAGATPLEGSAAEAAPPWPLQPSALIPAEPPASGSAALSAGPGDPAPAATRPVSESGLAPGPTAGGPASYVPSGAWASVAGGPTAGEGAGSKAGGGGGAHAAGGGTGGHGRDTASIPRSREVVLPQHVWLSEVGRTASAAFNIADPLSRFRAVNAPYQAHGELLPLMFGTDEGRGGASAGGGVVLDLHFQSAKTAPQVASA